MTALGLTNTRVGFSGFATMYAVARVIRAAGEDIALRGLAFVAMGIWGEPSFVH